MMDQNKQNQTMQYEVPTATKLGLILLTAILSCIAVSIKDLAVSGFCATFATATLSYLCVVTSSAGYVFSLFPSFCLALYPTPNITALYTIICLLAGTIALSLSTRARKNKTQSVLSVTVATATALLAMLALTFYGTYGTEAITAFKEAYQAIFDDVKNMIMLVLEETKAALVAQNRYTEAYDIFFSNSYITELVRVIKNMFVASLCVTVMAASYVSVSVFALISKKLHTDTLLPSEFQITVQKPTAVIYIVCVLLSFFASGDSLIYLAAENLTILFSPALLVVGVREKLRAMRQSKRFLIPLLLYFAAFLLSPMLPVYLLVFAGMTETLQKKTFPPKK